jgi:hypothetical protein
MCKTYVKAAQNKTFLTTPKTSAKTIPIQTQPKIQTSTTTQTPRQIDSLRARIHPDSPAYTQATPLPLQREKRGCFPPQKIQHKKND